MDFAQAVLPLHRLWLIPFFPYFFTTNSKKKAKMTQLQFSDVLSTFLCFVFDANLSESALNPAEAEASAVSWELRQERQHLQAIEQRIREHRRKPLTDKEMPGWPPGLSCTCCCACVSCMLGMIQIRNFPMCVFSEFGSGTGELLLTETPQRNNAWKRSLTFHFFFGYS